tara:strand:- start:116 stop:313 length:198 start_codon:yes stop_codon:yes gene_type:complete
MSQVRAEVHDSQAQQNQLMLSLLETGVEIMKMTDPKMPIELKLQGLKHMAEHIIEIIEAMERDNL